MPFGSYDAERPKSLPTFLQYIKTANKNLQGKTKFGVEVIWLPGKFDNVTLQTHAFRFICSSAHPLYNEAKEYAATVVDGNTRKRLDIIIDSIEDGTITVSESTKVNGHWEKLGTNAVKFKDASQ